MRDIVNLARYPLDQSSDPARAALVERCRKDLDREGMFNLEGFLRPEALDALVAEIRAPMVSESFRHARRHNIYFRPTLPDLPDDHPALQTFETINHTLCADQLASTRLHAVYSWPPFAAFLADTMGKPALYPMADPLAGLNAMAYHEGESLNWHFDRSEFTTTLLLQAPDAGGEFEYRSDLRSDDDPNYDGVARMLSGTDDAVQRLRLEPGTLNVFRGRNTAHRVTPVAGPRPRMIAVFSFFDRPGVCFSEAERLGFYGRTGARQA